ncbi:MAG: hypothetical protein ACYDCN_13505 [Bacteroidia bacterium]
MDDYNLLKLLNKKIADKKIIEVITSKARTVFHNKDYKSCLEIYNSIEQKDLLNNLDHKIIAHCKTHV